MFLRPGFMFYTEIPGEELLPDTDALKNALTDEKRKYILVRGLEYRRVKKDYIPENTKEIQEIGDIFLLEKVNWNQ